MTVRLIDGKEPIVFQAYPQNRDKCLKLYDNDYDTFSCTHTDHPNKRQHYNLAACKAEPVNNGTDNPSQLRMFIHEGIPKYNITKNWDFEFDNTETKNVGFSLAKHTNHNINNPN